MPTLLTHPIVPVALALGLGKKRIPTRLAFLGGLASVLPDLDVIAFRLGIPYAANFGHRGFSHSLLCALFIALASILLCSWLRAGRWKTFSFVFLSAASHGLLDTLTNGGLGIALLWPFSSERYFAPFRPIEVSPLSLSRFFSPRGLAVLQSELLWVWLPCLGSAFLVLNGRMLCRRAFCRRPEPVPEIRTDR